MKYDVEPISGFPHETGLLLASLDDSTREWKENLETPTIEAITWQPWEGSYSIGGLLLHIIECEAYWFECFAGKIPEKPEDIALWKAKEIDQMNGKWPVPYAEPIEWYFALHDEVRARVRTPLKTIEPTEEFTGGSDTYSLRWIVAHVVEHDSYHGGQAVLLHEMWKSQRSGRTQQ